MAAAAILLSCKRTEIKGLEASGIGVKMESLEASRAQPSTMVAISSQPKGRHCPGAPRIAWRSLRSQGRGRKGTWVGEVRVQREAESTIDISSSPPRREGEREGRGKIATISWCVETKRNPSRQIRLVGGRREQEETSTERSVFKERELSEEVSWRIFTRKSMSTARNCVAEESVEEERRVSHETAVTRSKTGPIGERR
jgi:hypothetical protein